MLYRFKVHGTYRCKPATASGIYLLHQSRRWDVYDVKSYARLLIFKHCSSYRPHGVDQLESFQLRAVGSLRHLREKARNFPYGLHSVQILTEHTRGDTLRSLSTLSNYMCMN